VAESHRRTARNRSREACALAEAEGRTAKEGRQRNSGKVRELIKNPRDHFGALFGAGLSRPRVEPEIERCSENLTIGSASKMTGVDVKRTDLIVSLRSQFGGRAVVRKFSNNLLVV
jgi:hypothetical protein